MRSKQIIATIAVVGAVATFAVLNMSTPSNNTNFMQFDEHTAAFSNFVAKYRKSYGTKEEYQYRKEVFLNNYHSIMNHNMMNSDDEGFFLRINQFADHTNEEFKRKLGFKKLGKRPASIEKREELDINAPSVLDWRSEGKVTPVKDQGACGSCWAFSTTGAIEGALAIKTGTLVSLSEQQLVDCDIGVDPKEDDHNMGCNGGDMGLAMDYVAVKGLETETDYPYEGYDDDCHYDETKSTNFIKSHIYVTPNDPVALLNAVAKGPVSVAIEADSFVFQFYGGGVFSSKSCGTDLDHGVLVVGYGMESMKDYWIVKNSWGLYWGDSGYIKIARDMNKSGPKDGLGICGIQMEPVQPQA